MSKSLKMVAEQLIQFKSGEIDLDTMWVKIDTNLIAMRHGEDYTDPFEDDKVDARTKLAAKH